LENLKKKEEQIKINYLKNIEKTKEKIEIVKFNYDKAA